jgi:hypothetical protein
MAVLLQLSAATRRRSAFTCSHPVEAIQVGTHVEPRVVDARDLQGGACQVFVLTAHRRHDLAHEVVAHVSLRPLRVPRLSSPGFAGG